MPLSNIDFSIEERSLLRAAFLRFIPLSDEVAAQLYAPFDLNSPEKIEEAIRHLATIVDAMEDSDSLEFAYRDSKRWHALQGISSAQLEGFGAAMVAALERISEAPSQRERELWLRLWSAVRSSE